MSKRQTKPLQRTSNQERQLNSIKIELKDFIQDFDAINSGVEIEKVGLNKIKKQNEEKELFKYLIAIENRYHYFKKQEQHKTEYTLTDAEKVNIGASIAANIEAVESNYAYEEFVNEQNNTKNVFKKFAMAIQPSALKITDYNNYQHSEEEFRARQNGKDLIIAKLREESNPSLATNRKIKLLETSKEIEKENFEYYSANKKFRKNPTKENKIELKRATRKIIIRKLKSLFVGRKYIYENSSMSGLYY